MTLFKCLFEVLYLQAFGAAAKNQVPIMPTVMPGTAPYVVKNDTGLNVIVYATEALSVLTSVLFYET